MSNSLRLQRVAVLARAVPPSLRWLSPTLLIVGLTLMPAYAAPVPPPTVTSIVPTSGPLAGGTIVTITGTGFTGVLGVNFGEVQAVSFTVNSNTSITATSPPGAASTVDIIVVTTNGLNVLVAADQFTFSAGQFIPGVPTPTLSEWAMIALGLLLAGGGYLALMSKPSGMKNPFGSRLGT